MKSPFYGSSLLRSWASVSVLYASSSGASKEVISFSFIS